jgi:hypothetical protein
MGSNLYIADTNNHAIRHVDLDTLTVTTLQFSGLCAPNVCIPPNDAPYQVRLNTYH